MYGAAQRGHVIKEERLGLSQVGDEAAEELALEGVQQLVEVLHNCCEGRTVRTAARVAMAARNASPSLDTSSPASSSSSCDTPPCLTPRLATALYLPPTVTRHIA